MLNTALLLLLGSLAQGATSQTQYVSFCEIVQHPELYDQKMVLTSGIYRAGAEFSEFIEADCPPTADRDVGTLPTTVGSQVHETSGWKRLSQLLDKEKQAFIVVRAVFDAYKRYQGPLPADPRMQQVLQEGNKRFGHNNFARFRLRIESVEFSAPVTK